MSACKRKPKERDQDSFEPRQFGKAQSELEVHIGKSVCGASRSRSAPSKQDAILALLQRPKGATLREITEATGWQPHSVCGFLSGVVKKKLKIKIESRKEGSNRTYRIKTRASS